MTKLLRPCLSLAALCLFVSQASAHSGHGEAGPGHYITSAEHLLPLGFFVTVLLLLCALAAKGKASPSVGDSGDRR